MGILPFTLEACFGHTGTACRRFACLSHEYPAVDFPIGGYAMLSEKCLRAASTHRADVSSSAQRASNSRTAPRRASGENSLMTTPTRSLETMASISPTPAFTRHGTPQARNSPRRVGAELFLENVGLMKNAPASICAMNPGTSRYSAARSSTLSGGTPSALILG